MLPDLCPPPQPLAAEGKDKTFELDFTLCCPRVDVPLAGGAQFLQDSFGGEGDEDLFALSPGDRRPDGGSLPFKRGGNVDGIVLGLLRHEDGVSDAASLASWVFLHCLEASYGLFERSNAT